MFRKNEMGKKLRKFNRATHRDLGYFFVAMILIYALSGIAINHINDWNPSYVLEVETYDEPVDVSKKLNKDDVKSILKDLKIRNPYRKHYYPNGENKSCKIFVKNGVVNINMKTGVVHSEITQRRVVFHVVNWLHYNPNVAWKWISDIFAGALIILAISGMFILKGKNGLKWRGTILMVAGVLLPLIFLFMFY